MALMIPVGAVYEFARDVPDGWDEPEPVVVTDVDEHTFDPDMTTVHVEGVESGEFHSHYADEFANGYRRVADSLDDYTA